MIPTCDQLNPDKNPEKLPAFPENPAAPSLRHDGDLAALAGVSRRRIYKWRAEGAPAGRDAGSWLAWFRQTGRTVHAERLSPPAPAPAISRQIDDLPQPPADATPSEADKHWRGLQRREEAILATIKRRQAEGDLVALEAATAAMRDLAAVLLEELGPGIWKAMRPQLDGVDPTLRSALRKSHDAALLSLRHRLPLVIGQRLTHHLAHQG
jgi:hypothetical protein